MSVLVSGGAGFLGSHIAHSLLSKGKSVRLIDKIAYNDAWRVKGIIPREDYAQGNLSTIKLEDVEVLYHFAWSSTPCSNLNDICSEVRDNLEPSFQLFQQAVDAGVKKIIYASSGGQVYGEIKKRKAKETCNPRPVTPYGIAKLTVEQGLEYFQKVYGIRYAAARIANPYGPLQTGVGAPGVIAIFLDNLLQGKKSIIFNQGSCVRDFIYVKDLVSAIHALSSLKIKDGTYNIGSGKGTSIKELSTIIEEVAERKLKVKEGEKRKEDIPYNVLDISRIKKEVGWKPTIKLDKGIERTWNFMQKHPLKKQQFLWSDVINDTYRKGR